MNYFLIDRQTKKSRNGTTQGQNGNNQVHNYEKNDPTLTRTTCQDHDNPCMALHAPMKTPNLNLKI